MFKVGKSHHSSVGRVFRGDAGAGLGYLEEREKHSGHTLLTSCEKKNK